MNPVWYFAVGFAAAVVVGRLLSNKNLNEWGYIPGWVSALYMLGFLGMLVSAAWSFFTVRWWAPLPIIALYFTTGIIRSMAAEDVREEAQDALAAKAQARVIAAVQQAAAEFNEMPAGDEKLRKVQDRMKELLGA
jgi:putative Ca2+/H+ antiporter (TMEM165/GDT1 family)